MLVSMPCCAKDFYAKTKMPWFSYPRLLRELSRPFFLQRLSLYPQPWPLIPQKTTKIYDETSRLTKIDPTIVHHVISHQFRFINSQLLYPSLPAFKVYRLGSFHLPRQKLITRLHWAIETLRRKRAIPFVYNHARQFLTTALPLRHDTKNFFSTSQLRFWARPTSNSTAAAQLTPRHHKDYYYRAPVGDAIIPTAPPSRADIDYLPSTIPATHSTL